MATRERRARADHFDKELIALFHDALILHQLQENDISLMATGGFGRGELFPGSDLDITFVHQKVDQETLKKFANQILFPLWDKGLKIDYSVRSPDEIRLAMKNDVKVVLGLLDSRFLAGNRKLAEDSTQAALNLWRNDFKHYLKAIKLSLSERYERSGELAFLLEPDIKEARGGLRDITLLRAFENHLPSEINLSRIGAAESVLSDVREALHLHSGNAKDILYFAEQDAIAKSLDYEDADAMMRVVAKSARVVDFALQRALQHFEQPKDSFFKKIKVEAVGRGLIAYGDEIRVEPEYDIKKDPAIGVRAAAIAAQRGFHLSHAAIRLFAENPIELPQPWPRAVREDFVAFIGAGTHMVEVFEALDQEELISKWIPEWEHVRFLPQRNVLHRHTVDRHMLETAVRASHLTRTVHRPDLLLIASLFHDLGKGFKDKDHSDYGAELISPLAARLGFDVEDIATLSLLVKEHLLLSTAATRRDLDDPKTILDVVGIVNDASTLELLHALSIADGEATGKTAWSSWKAGLVEDLVQRCKNAMAGVPFAPEVQLTQEQIERAFNSALSVDVREMGDFLEIDVVAPDRTGLLFTVAGVLAISRLDVRSAKTKTVGNSAFMTWLVQLDPHSPIPTSEKLTKLLNSALDGEIDLQGKIDERIRNFRSHSTNQSPEAVVTAKNDVATQATVLEVRMHDRPGVLFNVARTISRYSVDIRSAIVSTLGAEAFDTLYITDFKGNPLSAEESILLAQRVENYLLTL